MSPVWWNRLCKLMKNLVSKPENKKGKTNESNECDKDNRLLRACDCGGKYSCGTSRTPWTWSASCTLWSSSWWAWSSCRCGVRGRCSGRDHWRTGWSIAGTAASTPASAGYCRHPRSTAGCRRAATCGCCATAGCRLTATGCRPDNDRCHACSGGYDRCACCADNECWDILSI